MAARCPPACLSACLLPSLPACPQSRSLPVFILSLTSACLPGTASHSVRHHKLDMAIFLFLSPPVGMFRALSVGRKTGLALRLSLVAELGLRQPLQSFRLLVVSAPRAQTIVCWPLVSILKESAIEASGKPPL